MSDWGRPGREPRILVTGSRMWTDWHLVEVALRHEVLKLGGPPAVVVHGAANGADTCADIIARQMGLTVEPHPADWDRYGKQAGPIRNSLMVTLGADVCLAFAKPPPPGKLSGTFDCASKARAAGIPVVDYGVATMDASQEALW